MNVLVLHILLIVCHIYLVHGVDYCKMDCKGQQHSCCGFKFQPPKGSQILEPDAAWRTNMLHWHNYLRDKLASGKDTRGGNGRASNMMALSYDTDLEYTAACWIYQGKFGHDKCRRTGRFEKVGQNIWAGSTFDATKNETGGMKDIVEDWYGEIKDTSSNLIGRFGQAGRTIGHFTQVVWAETTHVGCARLDKKNTDPYRFYVACNYGPSGNFLGKPVYLRGQPASKCPKGLSAGTQYPNLCGDPKGVSTAKMKKASCSRISSRLYGVVSCVILFVLFYFYHDLAK